MAHRAGLIRFERLKLSEGNGRIEEEGEETDRTMSVYHADLEVDKILN